MMLQLASIILWGTLTILFDTLFWNMEVIKNFLYTSSKNGSISDENINCEQYTPNEQTIMNDKS